MITVLMAVYNGEAYLREAIVSILTQTRTDFEFLIVDDGSTDGTSSILAEYLNRDHRISILTNTENLGLANSLNRGIEHAHGDYIARMDADDICLPARLEKQAAYMDQHEDVGVCGAWARTLNTDRVEWRAPTDDPTIRCTLLFHTAFVHPSVMLRRAVLESTGLRYAPSYRQSQDYELWSRLASHTQFANIPEVLLIRRQHDEQISSAHSARQASYARRVRLYNIGQLGLAPTADEEEVHHCLAERRPLSTIAFVHAADHWLRKIQEANAIGEMFPEPSFSILLASHWFRTCRHAVELGWEVWRIFWASPLSRYSHIPLPTKVKFALLAAGNTYRP